MAVITQSDLNVRPCLSFLFLLSCLPSLREFSANRSVDNLDCIDGSVNSSFPRWDDDDYSQGCSTLDRNSCISQVSSFLGDIVLYDTPMVTNIVFIREHNNGHRMWTKNN